MEYERSVQKGILENEVREYHDLNRDEKCDMPSDRFLYDCDLDDSVQRYSLEEVLNGPFDELVREARRVNRLSKCDSDDWYSVKDALLKGIMIRALDVNGLSYGVGEDEQMPVLYVDLPKYGQISFHMPFMDKEVLELAPAYPYEWTGVGKDVPTKSIDDIDLKINIRDYLGENGSEFSSGDIHNMIAKAGKGKAGLDRFYEMLNAA